jgi:ABC-type uncharacterized transport system permease subunit
MVSDIVIHALASAAYAGLAWHFWNTRWRSASQDAPAGLAGWERVALALALALHGWLLANDILLAPQLRFGFAQALSITLWLAVAFYWIESLFVQLDGFEPLLLPLAASLRTVARAVPRPCEPRISTRVLNLLHLLLAMCAYSLFTPRDPHAALMAVVERARCIACGPAAARSGRCSPGRWRTCRRC